MSDSVFDKSIGLIGLGLLGSAVADRLVAAGYRVSGFDTNADCMNAFAAGNSPASESAAAVIRECPLVILSLPSSDVASRVIEDSRHAFFAGQTVIDTTTGNPTVMEQLGGSLRQMNVDYIEANVAGSSEQMRVGEATLFVGSESAVTPLVAGVLNALSAKWFELGPVGSASRFKLVHNLILGLHRAVFAEGLALAEQMGFDATQTLQILLQTPAASRAMSTKGQRMVSRNYEPVARLSQHLKDVRLMLEEAQAVGVHLPLTAVHRTLLESAERAGFGGSDNSAIAEVFRAADTGK